MEVEEEEEEERGMVVPGESVVEAGRPCKEQVCACVCVCLCVCVCVCE